MLPWKILYRAQSRETIWQHCPPRMRSSLCPAAYTREQQKAAPRFEVRSKSKARGRPSSAAPVLPGHRVGQSASAPILAIDFQKAGSPAPRDRESPCGWQASLGKNWLTGHGRRGRQTLDGLINARFP